MSAMTQPALERDHRPGRERQHGGDQRRQQEDALVGAGRDHRLLEHEFEEVGEGLQQSPKGPTTFGPRRSCTAAQILRSA